ncbi:MAG: integration host factor subunit beta [Bacteroidaceae bacterium]|nr:integration host factor subunit beta [Bacteroidaceae bacterium]MBQ3957674.1 integration host factor subunit beta [Bacteroidaceae bacterium]
MTKVELVKAVSAKTGIDQPTVLAALEGTIDTIMESLVERENVYLRGWGTWTLKHRAQKTARNISKNTTMLIEAHDIPYFKPCKDFMEAVAKAKK